MSVPVHAVEPPRQRPTVVTLAVWLLYLVAALQIVSLFVGLSEIGTIGDVYEDAYRGTEVEDVMRVTIVVATLGMSVLGALLAIAYVVLGLFTSRGKNPARITTWVLAGFWACCSAYGLIGNAASSTLDVSVSDSGDLPDPAVVQEQLEAALPSWYQPVSLALGVITLLALVAVIILLALPPANDFFRKPQPVWQPPSYPPGGYPPPGTYYPPPGTQPPPPGMQPPPPPDRG